MCRVKARTVVVPLNKLIRTKYILGYMEPRKLINVRDYIAGRYPVRWSKDPSAVGVGRSWPCVARRRAAYSTYLDPRRVVGTYVKGRHT